MEKREDTLREALQNNEEERQRWERYMKEQETAINNLDLFSKKLNVDVMVPIGRKAFMPGRLIHTNEVMVGHFQDYFSKCSSYTATEICRKRLEKAKTYLVKIEAEREFFENKLEKPYLDGVLPTTDEREIIEEYDEEKETIWREAHKEKIKKAKLKEKQERESLPVQDKPVDEIIQKLEEQDIMDELNEELNERDVETSRDTQEILSKLMSGEINLPPPKKRIAHCRTENDKNLLQDSKRETKVNPSQSLNCEQQEKTAENSVNVESNDDDSDTNTQEEVRLIQEQAEYLPKNDRAGFLQYQMHIIDGKIASIRPNDEGTIIEKMRLLNIRYYLEELIELYEEVPETDPEVTELEKETSTNVKSDKQQKRRISFALEDQMVEFRKNETVAQMMPIKSPTEDKPRDIILLDEPILSTNIDTSSNNTTKPKTIAEKVEENLKTQSLTDGYLVNKILDSSMAHATHTLHIHFKHSTQSPQLANSTKSNIPQSPADFYDLFLESQSESEVKKDEELKTKDVSRENAFVDVRSQFLSPLGTENIISETESKSILKNKSAVGLEKHIQDNNDKPKARKKNVKKPKDDGDCLSAYNKVMGDVLENNPTKPDPLPKEKFIDMHTPKKRISRFKQMRIDNQ